jgi:hypothetical protein
VSPPDDLHAQDRSSGQEPDHRLPVVRRPVRQKDGQFTSGADGVPASRAAAKRLRRTLKKLPEDLVESTNASEAGSHRDFRHRQSGFLDEPLGQEDAPGLCDGSRRGPYLLLEEAAQVALADTQASGHCIDIAVVEGAPSRSGTEP